LFSGTWGAAWPLFKQERSSRGGLPQAVYVKQKHKLPRSSAHHIALPVEPEGLAKVMDPVSISTVENSLQAEQSVALVMQPTRLIGRWLLLVC